MTAETFVKILEKIPLKSPSCDLTKKNGLLHSYFSRILISSQMSYFFQILIFFFFWFSVFFFSSLKRQNTGFFKNATVYSCIWLCGLTVWTCAQRTGGDSPHFDKNGIFYGGGGAPIHHSESWRILLHITITLLILVYYVCTCNFDFLVKFIFTFAVSLFQK